MLCTFKDVEKVKDTKTIMKNIEIVVFEIKK